MDLKQRYDTNRAIFHKHVWILVTLLLSSSNQIDQMLVIFNSPMVNFKHLVYCCSFFLKKKSVNFCFSNKFHYTYFLVQLNIMEKHTDNFKSK